MMSADGGASARTTAVAEAADAPAVIALWQACGLTRPWNDPAADFALALREAQADVLVLRDGAVVCGSVMVGFDGHRGWIYYLAVAPEWRHAGIGRALMRVAEDWLRARGAPKVQLMVRGDNAAALGFYEALGLARQDVAVFGRFLEDGAPT
jgi:ribosomal protein S18 acetylase RimI-like enzyme